MLRWLKLSLHHHSGRLRPHEHTSYIPLGILLLIVGLALIVYTAAAESPPPEPSSISLTGSMPGKPPTVAAVILKPTNQQRFSTSPVKISGTCPESTLVELFKNDIFAGSTICTKSGTFSLEIDLLIGKNKIIAQVYDALNQPGPKSNAVEIFYDAFPTQAGPISTLNFGGNQLLLNTDAAFRGSFPSQELSAPINIIGGTPPYAVNIQWGDTNNKVVSRDDNNTFKISHIYSKPGTYQISIQASDSLGRVAFLSVASIINGQPVINNIITASTAQNQLLVLWPLYASAVAVMISFWVGEMREKRILIKRGLLSRPLA